MPKSKSKTCQNGWCCKTCLKHGLQEHIAMHGSHQASLYKTCQKIVHKVGQTCQKVRHARMAAAAKHGSNMACNNTKLRSDAWLCKNARSRNMPKSKTLMPEDMDQTWLANNAKHGSHQASL